MGDFWREDGQVVLTKAIAAVEELSSAELVVAVRERSGCYRHIDFALGGVAAFACLAALLYVPWSFAWHYLLIDPAVVGVGVALLSQRTPTLQRVFLRRTSRHAKVLQAAKAEFFDRGIHHTQGRTGILLYVSLRERSAVLVADSGVELAVASDAWLAVSGDLRACVEAGGQAAELAAKIAALGELLAKYLPRDEADENELLNEVLR